MRGPIRFENRRKQGPQVSCLLMEQTKEEKEEKDKGEIMFTFDCLVPKEAQLK